MSDWCENKWGDAYSGQPPLVAAIAYIVVVTEIAPFVLRGPPQLPIAYLFAALWGAGMGPYYSLLKPVYFFIVPGGQEAKYAALFSMSQVIISWVPLLAFTVIYEGTGSLAGGFHCMAVFALVGGCLIKSIDMEKARSDVMKSGTLDMRAAAMGAASNPLDEAADDKL